MEDLNQYRTPQRETMKIIHERPFNKSGTHMQCLIGILMWLVRDYDTLDLAFKQKIILLKDGVRMDLM